MKPKYAPGVQIAQRHLFHYYEHHLRERKNFNLSTAGFRVFSQFEEDGLILCLLAGIGIKHYRFIEIGSDDGLNSNGANLIFNLGWTGLFIDANKWSVDRGRYFYARYPHPFGSKPEFYLGKVTRENINTILTTTGYTGEVDFLSIDIDGNDYWIWDALEVVRPRIVMIETHIIYGDMDIVVPYDPEYAFPGQHPQYHGASPKAMVRLGRKKGYRLVGANQLGFNFIFLRNDEGVDIFPEVEYQTILAHPLCTIEPPDDKVMDMPFIRPEVPE